MSSQQLAFLAVAAAALLHALGLVSALHAVVKVRTPQGSIAWAVSLVGFPYVALPLYWVFGPRHFERQVEAIRQSQGRRRQQIEKVRAELDRHRALLAPALEQQLGVFATLAKRPFTRGNRIELLVDGEATFGAIFAAIEGAESYVLVQFFIVHADALGNELKERLVRKARAGVRVHFLGDEVGCVRLPQSYFRELQAAGVEVHAFKTGRGGGLRSALNFLNHRKIVVVDGRSAFVGGANVGDEYMGRSHRFGPWRDTHVKIEGPAVQCVQTTFQADWVWAGGEELELEWNPCTSDGSDRAVLSLATGPADREESCALFFLQAISAARERLWIASPYFVPDPSVFEALKLAALRGVDVRVLLPNRPDHILVYLASFSFLSAAERAGIGIWRYQHGFLHQKVLLIDDRVAAVGTANLDNRSFRLNFEIITLVADSGFAGEVRAMLERDFARSRKTSAADFEQRSWLFRAAVEIARLFEPIL